MLDMCKITFFCRRRRRLFFKDIGKKSEHILYANQQTKKLRCLYAQIIFYYIINARIL